MSSPFLFLPLHLPSHSPPSLHPLSSKPAALIPPDSTSLQRPILPYPIPFRQARTNSTRRLVPLAVNFTAGNPDGPSKELDIDGILDRARNLFDNLPQPVKNFPWIQALENFFHLIFDLALAVAKYLSVPILAVSSLSEMSYCAHERKMVLIPVPFLVGFAVAGALKDTALELSSDLKEGGFPWHLLLIAIFFTLLKLPGPYYPYWGRLLIPHFANGGLWRSVWLAFMWYRGSRSWSELILGSSQGDAKKQ